VRAAVTVQVREQVPVRAPERVTVLDDGLGELPPPPQPARTTEPSSAATSIFESRCLFMVLSQFPAQL
jgi:hypothetical protein